MAENLELIQVNSFINSTDKMLTVSQLEESFSTVINELRFKQVSYTIHKVKPNHSEESSYSLTNHYIDQWDTHYWKEDYFNIDHIAKRTCKMMLPYAWDLQEAYEEYPKNTLYQDALDYGLSQGISIPVFQRQGEFGMLVVHHPKAKQEFLENSLLRHSLHLLAMHFHSALIPFQDKLTPCDLSLTPREHQCLSLTREGFSAGEIARKLSISTRTVHFHIGNIIRHFKVQGKYQAVMLALEYRLI